MKLFIIKQPNVSYTYNKIYNKELEVFECEFYNGKNRLDEFLRNNDYYSIKSNIIYRYNHFNRSWKKYRITTQLKISSICDITSTNVKNYNMSTHDSSFIRIEAAKIAKLTLLNLLEEDYIDEIERLKETLSNELRNTYNNTEKLKIKKYYLKKIKKIKFSKFNLPNIKQPLKEIKNEYPEYFI